MDIKSHLQSLLRNHGYGSTIPSDQEIRRQLSNGQDDLLQDSNTQSTTNSVPVQKNRAARIFDKAWKSSDVKKELDQAKQVLKYLLPLALAIIGGYIGFKGHQKYKEHKEFDYRGFSS